MKLYGYWRLTSSYRMRIALALKGLSPEQVTVHLVRNGGEHLGPEYRAVNPQRRVPSLKLDNGTILTPSPAIIEDLEERYPEPRLLPTDLISRAKVRAAAAIIGCGIQSLHNSGPLNHLRGELGRSDAEVAAWIGRWIGNGLEGVEALIESQPFCFGSDPAVADVYLTPQLHAARRFAVPLEAFPKILGVEKTAAAHPAFAVSRPSRQLDAE